MMTVELDQVLLKCDERESLNSLHIWKSHLCCIELHKGWAHAI